MKTWVYLDHFQGQVVPAAWEALALAKTFGLVTVLVFGKDVEAFADDAFAFGADDVLQADDPTLGFYCAETYASTLSVLAAAHNPDLILFPATSRCREIAAMSAIDLGTGVLTDVIALERDGDRLTATRPIYEGKLFEKLVCSARPTLMTLRARAFPRPTRDAAAGRHGGLLRMTAHADRLTIVEHEYAETQRSVGLMDAAIIVAGGRGILDDEKPGLLLLEELAALLDGAVAASRPPVETGLVSAGQLIGQSGKIVSPDLYFAVGISGTPQHIAGIRSAGLVVAINKDAQAPIFAVSRYGVVGDLFQIIPALIAAFKKKMNIHDGV